MDWNVLETNRRNNRYMDMLTADASYSRFMEMESNIKPISYEPKRKMLDM